MAEPFENRFEGAGSGLLGSVEIASQAHQVLFVLLEQDLHQSQGRDGAQERAGRIHYGHGRFPFPDRRPGRHFPVHVIHGFRWTRAHEFRCERFRRRGQKILDSDASQVNPVPAYRQVGCAGESPGREEDESLRFAAIRSDDGNVPDRLVPSRIMGRGFGRYRHGNRLRVTTYGFRAAAARPTSDRRRRRKAPRRLLR